MISVIMPVYNVEAYVEKCVYSILKQTYQDFELIIIDDGSTDTSGKICDGLKERDIRIKVIHKNNGGLMSAWITGFYESKGQFIFFVDSDDWVDDNILEKMTSMIEKNPDTDLVVCDCKRELKNETQVYKMFQYQENVYDYKKIQEEIYNTIINNGGFQTRGIQVNRWGKLIKRELLSKNIKYCDTKISYGEDFNIMLPVFLDCRKICFVDETYYHYRYNGQSILGKYNNRMYFQVELLYRILFQVIKDKNCEFLRAQLLADYLSSIVLCVKNEIKSEKTIRAIIIELQKFRKANYLKESIKTTNYSSYSLPNRTIISMLKKKSPMDNIMLWVMKLMFQRKLKKVAY